MKQKTDVSCVLLSGALSEQVPTSAMFSQWVQQVIDHQGKFFQVSIEVVNEDFSRQLNNDYRGKDKPTNVLSFPLDIPAELEQDLIGDLAICSNVVEQEALEQNKPLMHHWAHMTIHGTLHLLGYDHIDDEEAEQMEALEIKLLKGLNIANPYGDGL